MAAGAARVRVTFQVYADGLLSVSAQEMSSGAHASITVKPSYGLSDDEVARMLQESYGAVDADMHARGLREQQVEAQRLVEATQAALAADGDLLSDAERADVERWMTALQTAAQGTDPAAVKQAIKTLAQGTDEFAERRMDRSIRTALSGRRIDEVAGATVPAK